MPSLQRKIKSGNTAVNKIENTYKNVNKTDCENITATTEVTKIFFEKLCSSNNEIEELAEDAENKEINDGCLQCEINITKRINDLKLLVDNKKG